MLVLHGKNLRLWYFARNKKWLFSITKIKTTENFHSLMNFGKKVSTLVEGSCMQVSEDLWCYVQFHNILENAIKILHSLQNDCCMEVVRKFFDALRRNLSIFFATYRTLQVSIVVFCKTSSFKKIKWKFILVVLQNVPCNLKRFLCTLIVIRCNQILSCG